VPTVIMKDAMTDSSPISETAQFVIKILAAREMSAADLPTTIANVRQVLQRLRGGVATAIPDQRFERTIKARVPIARPTPVRRAPPLPAVSRPAPEPVVYPERPRRGRPRLTAKALAPEPRQDVIEPAPQQPQQPRLLRRADAVAPSEADNGATPAMLRAPAGALRGVVKWYDGRAGKGALRLVGISGDVLIDPAALERSGIKRLYKDQEVEATVQEQAGRVRLVSLKLPGRSSESPRATLGGEVTSTVRRQPRSVTVEVKRDGVRQSAARAEAEQVLGGVNRIKTSRRPNP
jgi:cold shock CspA family protein